MESRIYLTASSSRSTAESLNPCCNGISYIQSMNQSITSRSSFVCIVEPLDCQHCVTFSQELSQMYVDFVFKCWNLAISELRNSLFFNRLPLFKIFANDLGIWCFLASCEKSQFITLDFQALLRCKNTTFSQIPQLFRQENDICKNFSSASLPPFCFKVLIIKQETTIAFFANDSDSNKPKNVVL